MSSESDVVLMTDMEVRKALSDRELRYSILSPYGSWLGRGALRVLRVKPREDHVLDIVLGYEFYEKFDPGSSP